MVDELAERRAKNEYDRIVRLGWDELVDAFEGDRDGAWVYAVCHLGRDGLYASGKKIESGVDWMEQ